MSIADKLTRIAENVPKVYFAGHSVGKTVGEHIGYDKGVNETEAEISEHLSEPIATINQYLENPEAPTSVHGRISYLDENIPEVYARGVKDWWLKLQQGKESYGYRNAFWGGSWTDETYKPVIDIVALSGKSQNEMFRGTSVTDVKVSVDFKQSGSTYVFSSGYIEKIPLLKVTESVTYENWFTGCTALTDITMSGPIGNDISFQDSPLNKASIESVEGCLSTTVSGKTLTLKESAVINAFGSLSSQEWLNLINTKSNWEISII